MNVFGTANKPAVLKFRDAEITFSARSILVENYGFLLAGWSQTMGMPKPIGTKPGGSLTIRLYGTRHRPAHRCKPAHRMQIRADVRRRSGDLELERRSDEASVETPSLPGGPDFFYNYDTMPVTEAPRAPARR